MRRNFRAGSTLLNRLELRDELYLYTYCAFWQIEAWSVPKGAVLEVACQAEEGQAFFDDLGPMMGNALSGGTIGFLIQ